MKYILISQMFLSALLAHGHSEQHLHFFSSLHVEYFAMFIFGLISALIVYKKLLKSKS